MADFFRDIPSWVIALIIMAVAIYNLLGANLGWGFWWNGRQIRFWSTFMPRIFIRVLYSAISVLALVIAIGVLVGFVQ